jgi:hypothetical protein
LPVAIYPPDVRDYPEQTRIGDIGGLFFVDLLCEHAIGVELRESVVRCLFTMKRDFNRNRPLRELAHFEHLPHGLLESLDVLDQPEGYSAILCIDELNTKHRHFSLPR